MSVPTHSIHSIHGTFAGVPSYTTFSSNAGVVIEGSPINKIHPGFARTASWRIAPASLPSSSSRRLPSFPVARRVPPPPPPRAIAPQAIPFPSENPFNDSNECALPVPQRPIPQRTHLASQSYTVRLPGSNPIDVLVRQRTAQRAAQERETRCKVVAGILLNRVHAVGKPMRRLPPSTEAPRAYKRSRLSMTTTAEEVC
ncbi:uncharacterized protein F5891DRAFT_1036040 [Suillus fuscotomentosus]|uniref:Uncharacterized protein n=1 Tax=Suillus fuscotomentosus TaxID=1912939 RepID=A0AAD4HLQ9_9AGAM|nr:uncharacterized protein F5891DRAFT_1036040 [Suillus fuscotomentosus]KAG1900089.1 hypothetical protein F5891DRAFT_1036040 [Suillus fuscotomentosus]